jgi:hypothetical protein
MSDQSVYLVLTISKEGLLQTLRCNRKTTADAISELLAMSSHKDGIVTVLHDPPLIGQVAGWGGLEQ